MINSFINFNYYRGVRKPSGKTVKTLIKAGKILIRPMERTIICKDGIIIYRYEEEGKESLPPFFI